mgnify:CR=1 FL=1
MLALALALALLYRSLRLGVEDMGADGLTRTMAALSLPPPAPPATTAAAAPATATTATYTPHALIIDVYHHASAELAAQELTSHLVSLLGALLLQDASRIRYPPSHCSAPLCSLLLCPSLVPVKSAATRQ